MGKTKTSFVSDSTKAVSSEQKYKEKKERQAKEHANEKVHVAGLKGGQRVKMVEAEVNNEPATTSQSEKSGKSTEKIRSKKYQDAKKKIEAGKAYSLKDAISLLRTVSYSKFDGTVEIHLTVKKVGLSANLTLPHASGKQKKVEIANDETIKKLTAGKIDFDVLLATPDMMPKLVSFARLLGPKGLMPNPKNGTIIKSAKDADKYSVNALNLKTEKEAPLVHLGVGKLSLKDSDISENIEAVFKAFGGSKQIVKCFVKSTMSPSIRLQI